VEEEPRLFPVTLFLIEDVENTQEFIPKSGSGISGRISTHKRQWARNPLGRIVGNPLTEIDTAWASAQGSNGRFSSRWITSELPVIQELHHLGPLGFYGDQSSKRSPISGQ
jgi:hypothetical protein